MEQKPPSAVLVWDGIERRQAANRRRQNQERRSLQERRTDRREGATSRRGFLAWLRSLTHARLGVDRRKGGNQRVRDRRNATLRSLLTKDELNDLLK